MGKKSVFGLIFAFFSGIYIFAAPVVKPDYIITDKRIFQDAVIAYESQDYGKSLRLLEHAEAYRRNKVAWETSILQNSFKPAEVKIRGDNLFDIIPVLEERQDYDALEIIERYFKYFGADYFESSSKKLLDYIKNHKEYPEVSYLKGKIYQLEGEYQFAEKLFLQAYKNSSILDIPDQKYDILYSLVDIAYTQKELKKYEEYLLMILSFDSAFKDASLISSMNNVIQSTKPDAMEKFFLMYRCSNYRLLNAYFRLSEYYLSKNEREKALNAVSLGALTGFTKMYDVVSKRNPEFEYLGFSQLLREASTYEDLVEWGKENNVWRGFNEFADGAFRNNCPLFAISLFNILKDESPEEYWRLDAKKKILVVTGQEKAFQ